MYIHNTHEEFQRTPYCGEESVFATCCRRAWSQAMWSHINYSFTRCLAQAWAFGEELLFASGLTPRCHCSQVPISEGQEKRCSQALQLTAAVAKGEQGAFA